MKLTPKLSTGLFTWLILTIALVTAGLLYSQNQDLRKHPEKVAQRELAGLVVSVGRLMELPSGEEPQLATVSDAAKLKTDQPFFANAQNGDKVLIYQKAKKAILYRPSLGKVIEVGPVTMSNPAVIPSPLPTLTTPPTTPAPTPTPSPVVTNESASVVLLNGTTTVGLTAGAEAKLAQEAPEIHIQSKETAKKNDYQKTLIIDLTNHPAAAARVATILKGAVSPLPAGEQTPAGADLLVILGSDWTQ